MLSNRHRRTPLPGPLPVASLRQPKMAVLEEESSSLWLAAHDDVMSGLRTFSTCMALADLHGDGDHKLVVGVPLGAGGGPELAVLSGSGPPRRHPLPEAPSALGVFWGGPSGPPFSQGGGSSSGGAAPPPALLVVAAGGALYVYRNLRPFYKCTLPPPGPPHEVEAELWAQVAQDEVDPMTLREMLEDIRDKAEVPLTPRSQWLLTLPPPEVPPFVALHKGRPLQRQSVVSCLCALPRGGPDGTPDCPVVGTEGGDILVLDPDAFTVLCKSWLPAPPAFVVPRGGDGRFRLAAACRDGGLYGIHRSRCRLLASLGSPPLGLLDGDEELLAVGTQGVLMAFSPQGRRLWSLRPRSPVVSMGRAALRGRGRQGVLLGLQDGAVRLYCGRSLVCVLRAKEPVTGLCFGRYGREDNSLIATTRGGALAVRMLKRKAELGGGAAPTPPHWNSGPGGGAEKGGGALPLPPRSRTFVDQAVREREDGTWMHERFQKDLWGLRLRAARSLAGAVTGGGQHGGTPPGLTVTATVHGVGLRLRLSLQLLLPGGSPPTPDLLLLLRCPTAPPRLDPPIIQVPLLLPGLRYAVGAWMEVEKGNPPPYLQVLVLRRGRCSALQSLLVAVRPWAELSPA